MSESPRLGVAASSQMARVPAIEYHDTEYNGGALVRMRTEWFLEQMQWLSEHGFRTLTGEDFNGFVHGVWKPAQRACVLRFDLGQPTSRNTRDVIIPALRQYSFRALFFVLTSVIKEGPEDSCHTWDELREWERAGLIEVGSHGVYHPNYRKTGLAKCKWDARISKQVIETRLGHPISFFAYPYDSVPDHPDVLLKPLGYTLALRGHRKERSILFSDPDPYALPCYYPYSSERTYPVMSAAKGLTFGQMMEGAVAGVAGPT
jgi:peptidoglycan/xylan/chitin deacetylase (PgdA/CDA1 family)